MLYPARLTPDDNGTVLIAFPDVPGAVSFGNTPDEAIAHGLDALLTMFDGLMKERRPIPEPSAPDPTAVLVVVPPLEAAKVALYQAMHTARVSKAELGRRLNVHGPQVDRILNVRHSSQIEQLSAAAGALGRRLELRLVDPAPSRAALRHRGLTGQGKSGRAVRQSVGAAGKRVVRAPAAGVARRASRKR
jgi:antitoxin HicB